MNILLIADTCVDAFIYCDTSRLSPERPVPVLLPHSIRNNPGMGGNVLANLLSLAPAAKVTPLFPPEPSVKTRYVDRGSNQHFVRVDQDVVARPLDVGAFVDVLDYTDDGAGTPVKWDAVVVSDYAKGYLNTDNMGAIALLCENRELPLFMDTKATLGKWSEPVTVVKINAKEYAAQFTAGVKEPWKWCKNLLVTQGARGMMLLDEEGGEEYRTQTRQIDVKDVVGAGDAALAGLVIGYLETQDLARAMDFATRVSEVAVSKPGVVAVRREEVV
jgi:D-beta-D-heptose 7-phosphate kinase/D-beta-D-heptose 1-phosphate adenosyltransferase